MFEETPGGMCRELSRFVDGQIPFRFMNQRPVHIDFRFFDFSRIEREFVAGSQNFRRADFTAVDLEFSAPDRLLPLIA